MPEIEANNQAAPAAEAPATTGQASTAGNEGTTSDPEGATNQPPTTSAAPGKSEFDVQKSYAELRREFTKRTQHEKELMTRLAAMEESFQKQAELLARATEEPFNPDTFKQTWETQGPKALDPYIQKREQALQSKYDKQLADMQTQMMQDRIQLNLALRRGDEETYPDFHALEPVMNDIAASDNCPVDLTKPIGEVLDALYKLAREANTGDALKQAEKIGAKNKEAELAKEAQTAVAGGGKHQGVTTPDFSKMSVADMRKQFVSKFGEAE